MIYGQPITFGGKSAPVLLWTNASPTSSFAAQVVTIETGYSAYLVEYEESKSTTGRKGVAYLPFSSEEQVSGVATYKTSNTSLRSVQRIINSCSDGSIDFGKGFLDGGSNGSLYGIPTRIWGVKFTL